MKQVWHDLLFAHWPIAPAVMRAAIPNSLELDLFDGEAWLGVVPFRMSGIRPRNMPPLPWLSAFPELNLRTYVRVGDKPGVYFFSLDAGNAMAVEIARGWFHLPYFRARMSCAREGLSSTSAGDDIRYASARTDRRGAPAQFVARYGPRGAESADGPSDLEHWLTERYCMYTFDARDTLLCGDIHHRRWPLQPAAAEIATNTLPRAHGFELPQREPLLHFARKLEVLVWSLAPAGSAARSQR